MLRKSFQQRTVRIAFAVGERVMLPVAGDPLLGHDRRRQPQPEPHRKRGEIMQLHAAMRLRAMQKQRDADVREMPAMTMKRTGFHQSAAQLPKSGILSVLRCVFSCFFESQSTGSLQALPIEVHYRATIQAT